PASKAKSKAKPKQPTRRKAQPKPTPAASKAVKFAEPTEESEVDANPADSAPPPPATTRVSRSSPPMRRTGRRGKGTQPSYAEPDIEIEIDDVDTNGQTNGGGNESDDSEITFNIAPPPAPSPAPVPAPAPVSKPPAPKRGGNGTRAPRRKKSVAELSAELHTQPARKRATSSAATAVVDVEVAALSINDSVEAPPARRPSPKRKQPGATTTAFAQPVVESSESGEGAAGLKKKRKLNLSRMRSLMGITADRSAASAANAQAVKFAVPRIRAAANAATPAPLSATSHGADSADSD
ncbi:hypothetical protein GGI24_004817, partial [Coemansia furcata]